MKKILITLPLDEKQKADFRETAEGCEAIFMRPSDLTARDLAGVSAVIGNIAPGLLASAGSLEWLQLNSAGYDAYSKPGVLPRGVRLTHASGAYGVAVSEHMVALTLMLQKKLHLYRDNMASRIWRGEGGVTSPRGSRVLTVGTGDIGQGYAMRMGALGAEVFGVRRRVSERPPYFNEVYPVERLPDILPLMDIVALALPGSPELYHFFGAEKFAAMKPGALFVNAGRGTLVDHDALLAALESGRLAGAALDVTEPEPLPPDSPLWRQKNLIITPHVAGGFHLPYTLEKIIELARRNLVIYLAGGELENLIGAGHSNPGISDNIQ